MVTEVKKDEIIVILNYVLKNIEVYGSTKKIIYEYISILIAK